MKTFSIFAEDDGPIPSRECAKVSFSMVYIGPTPEQECATVMTATDDMIQRGLALVSYPLLYTGMQGYVWLHNISDKPVTIEIGERIGEGVWVTLS